MLPKRPLPLAKFWQPCGVVVDDKGDVYIADSKSHRLRKILVSQNTSITVVGPGGDSFKSSPGREARVGMFFSIAIDRARKVLYIAGATTHQIYRVSLR